MVSHENSGNKLVPDCKVPMYCPKILNLQRNYTENRKLDSKDDVTVYVTIRWCCSLQEVLDDT